MWWWVARGEGAATFNATREECISLFDNAKVLSRLVDDKFAN